MSAISHTILIIVVVFFFNLETFSDAGAVATLATPTVDFELQWHSVTGEDGTTYPESSVLFVCQFEEDIYDGTRYKVTWLNDRGSIYDTGYTYSSNDRILELDESEFQSIGFNIGDQVYCDVTYRRSDRSADILHSDPQLIGIEILTPSLTFSNREDVNSDNNVIKLKPTIPISCRYRYTCELWLQMYIPPGDSCGQSITLKNEVCGVELQSGHWSETQEATIPLKLFNEGEYATDQDYSVYLRIADDDALGIWSNYSLPPIYIHIRAEHEVYEGKRCYSLNDPHDKTFDGRYFDNHQPGTFVLYHHIDFDTEIQVKYKTCRTANGIDIKCNCGLAVRAGLDVFIVDVCDPSTPNRIEFKNCGAFRALSVRRPSVNSKIYTIHFKYGTYVSVTLVLKNGSWLLEIVIIPSKEDQGSKTRGLCGQMDDNPANDFHFRNGTLMEDSVVTWGVKNQPLTFINSWRVNDPTNDMFEDEYIQPEVKPLSFSVCKCTETGYEAVNIVTCEQSTSATCTLSESQEVGTHSCSINRRRRSVDRRQSVPSFNHRHSSMRKREISDKNFTVAEAGKICNELIGKSSLYELCADVPSTSPHDYINNCIQDLVMTGDEDWVTVSKENLQGCCLNELRRNTTFSEYDTDDKNIADSIKQIACPMDCNDRGICQHGRCVCSEGYSSSDCSLDLATPPFLAGILDSGLCDEYDLPCDYAYVFGDLFSDDDGLTCRLEEFNILPDGTREYGSSHYVLAELETLFEVRCPLSTTRQRREASSNDTNIFVSGFTISISNDGTNFGSGVDLFIYTSECQLVVVAGGKAYFSVMPGFCFLEGRCLPEGSSHPTNNCTSCDTTQSQTSWSFVEDGDECVLPRGNHNNGINVGLVVGMCMACVAVVVIAVTTVMYIKWKTKEKRQKIGTLSFDLSSFSSPTDKVSSVKFDPDMLLK